MYRLFIQPVLLEPPIDLSPIHMPPGQPTRSPGTPVGELLARRPLQTTPPESRPKPSKRRSLPFDIFCSESDSDATSTEMPASRATSVQKPDEKPKPSAAPHLRLSVDAPQPRAEALPRWILATRLISIFAGIWYRTLPLARVPRNRTLGLRLVPAPSYWCARVFGAVGASASNQSASA